MNRPPPTTSASLLASSSRLPAARRGHARWQPGGADDGRHHAVDLGCGGHLAQGPRRRPAPRSSRRRGGDRLRSSAARAALGTTATRVGSAGIDRPASPCAGRRSGPRPRSARGGGRRHRACSSPPSRWSRGWPAAAACSSPPRYSRANAERHREYRQQRIDAIEPHRRARAAAGSNPWHPRRA